MRLRTRILAVAALGIAASFAPAQGPPGGFGPPGKGRFGGPPQPGQLLPGFLQDSLKLTAEQKKQVADLQKDVDAKLAQILTADQRKQLAQMKRRGPGRFGPGGFGPPGPGGFGPPGPGGRRGGPPPDGGAGPGDRPKQ
jgi:Spy/CpxP family protein refolding chaperone